MGRDGRLLAPSGSGPCVRGFDTTRSGVQQSDERACPMTFRSRTVALTECACLAWLDVPA
jgi:hypothetical protein